ncbi:histidine phosphatase family protein [Polyangium jinanense]|uniref:histidine phosphatase family protein n=1 Tax=Polyangium jinanense TaxID=2829994 RepID=UPI002341EA66|nr:histidine phosphatase family protein [Polyangium jinanense]MDC3955760.1 histidine phosphatase family protein [Polyangium jinanense]
MKKVLVGTSLILGLWGAGSGCTGEGGAGGRGGTVIDPSELKASVALGDVELSWVKSGKPASRIVRAENAMPKGPDDPMATVVYEGAASTASEPLRNLVATTPDMPRTYHYAVYGCDAPGSCGGRPATAELAVTIGQALIGGGYNLVWRHAEAEVCEDAFQLGTAAETSSPGWWKSCDSNCATATARQLNATGISQAEQMGLAIKNRGFPFGRVLASEFCRCMKTAELMNLGPAVEPNQDITGFAYDEGNRCANTMSLVATEPPPGTNVAIVGHAGHQCGVLDALQWGEAAIYKPDGSGGSIYITRVDSTSWASLQ